MEIAVDEMGEIIGGPGMLLLKTFPVVWGRLEEGVDFGIGFGVLGKTFSIEDMVPVEIIQDEF